DEIGLQLFGPHAREAVNQEVRVLVRHAASLHLLFRRSEDLCRAFEDCFEALSPAETRYDLDALGDEMAFVVRQHDMRLASQIEQRLQKNDVRPAGRRGIAEK